MSAAHRSQHRRSSSPSQRRSSRPSSPSTSSPSLALAQTVFVHQPPQNEDDVLLTVEDACEALVESARIEQDVASYSALVRADATRVSQALQREQIDEADGFQRYMRDITRQRLPMTKAQALTAAREGRVNDLIEGNVLLVVAVALRWRSARRSLIDLIGEGNIGLTIAAQRFEWQRDWAFSTYGMFYIRRYIREEALRQDMSTASTPSYVRRTYGSLLFRRRQLERELDRPLTLHETSAYLRDHQIASPTHASAWPDDLELTTWLATTSATYFSQILHHANPTTDNRDMDYDSSIATTDTALDAAEARADVEALHRDLRALSRHHLVTRDEMQLLVLRYGLPHPNKRWKAPVGWELGMPKSLRWVARANGTKREKTRLLLASILARLETSPHDVACRVASTLRSPDTLIRYYISS